MILIAAGQEDIGAVLERLLRCAVHEAIYVPGSEEALAMLATRQPSLLAHATLLSF